MNKTEFINKMAEISGFSKKDTGVAVDAFIETLTAGLKEDGKIQFVGFGNFEVRERAARKGRNPQTGEEIDIPASKTVAYKAATPYKKQFN